MRITAPGVGTGDLMGGRDEAVCVSLPVLVLDLCNLRLLFEGPVSPKGQLTQRSGRQVAGRRVTGSLRALSATGWLRRCRASHRPRAAGEAHSKLAAMAARSRAAGGDNTPAEAAHVPNPDASLCASDHRHLG